MAGPWLADLLRDEYRWRLSVYRDYLRLDDDDDDDRRSRCVGSHELRRVVDRFSGETRTGDRTEFRTESCCSHA